MLILFRVVLVASSVCQTVELISNQQKYKRAGAELCQAQRCLVGYEIRFEQNYFYQNEFYRNELRQNALSQLEFRQNDFRQ